MGKKKPETISAAIQKAVDKYNKMQEKSLETFRAAQKKAGKKSDEPIDIFDLLL